MSVGLFEDRPQMRAHCKLGQRLRRGNVGDILARWSNDLFVSTPHRVINRSGRERYSQPFFFDPSMDTLIEALPPTVPAGAKPKYEPVAYGDYLMERIDKNYHYRKKAS